MQAASQSTSDFKGDHLSVKMFGAVGDGVHDDTAAIQAAIDKCKAAADLSSKRLLFPGGNYKTAGTLYITDQILLTGDSERGSHINYAGNGTAIDISNGTEMTFHVHLKNLRVLATGSGAIGISMSYTSESYLEYVTVRNFAVGVQLQNSNNIYIDRYTSDENPIGLYLKNGATGTNNFISIKHGNFWSSDTAAIKLEGSAGFNLIDNYFEYFTTALLFSATSPSYFEMRNAVIRNNWFLSQTPALFATPNLITTSFGSGVDATITNMTIADNYADLRDPTVAVNLDWTGTSAGSYVRAVIADNFFTGASVSSIYGDSLKVRLTLLNNASYSNYSTGAAVAQVSGSPVYTLHSYIGPLYTVGLADVAPTAGMYVTRGTADNRLPSTITDAAIIGENKSTMGTGAGKIYGALGVSTGWGDAEGDRSYGGYFKASAENHVTTEVGVHAEVADDGGAIAEFYRSTVRRGWWSGLGNLMVGDIPDNGVDKLQVDGSASFESAVLTASESPASNAAGTTGTLAWDADYIYVCTASGVWKRAALTGGY